MEAKYFIMERHKDTLKSQNCKELNKWLGMVNYHEGYGKISNWKYLCATWNRVNTDNKEATVIPNDIVKPDYDIILEE